MKHKAVYLLMYILIMIVFIISMILMISLGVQVGGEAHTISDSVGLERTARDNQIIFVRNIYMLFVIIDITIFILLENVVYNKKKETIIKKEQLYENDNEKDNLLKKAKRQLNVFRIITILLIIPFLMLASLVSILR